jgi:hypothetical protein
MGANDQFFLWQRGGVVGYAALRDAIPHAIVRQGIRRLAAPEDHVRA